MSRLWRAFLLRVHPDRFGTASANQGTSTTTTAAVRNNHLRRQQQAALVQALGNWLTESDFVQWQQQQAPQQSSSSSSPTHSCVQSNHHHQRGGGAAVYPNSLERRGGGALLQLIAREKHVATVQHALSLVKLQQGFTCPSWEYHACLERWAAKVTTSGGLEPLRTTKRNRPRRTCSCWSP